MTGEERRLLSDIEIFSPAPLNLGWGKWGKSEKTFIFKGLKSPKGNYLFMGKLGI